MSRVPKCQYENCSLTIVDYGVETTWSLRRKCKTIREQNIIYNTLIFLAAAIILVFKWGNAEISTCSIGKGDFHQFDTLIHSMSKLCIEFETVRRLREKVLDHGINL